MVTKIMPGLSQPMSSSHLPARRWLPLGILLTGLTLFFVLGAQRYLSFETLHQHHDQLHRYVDGHGVLSAFAFMLAYAAMAAFSLPGGTLMTVFGGYLFGPYVGAGYVVIGATLGASVLFLAARTSLGAYLEAKAGPFLQRMEAGFQANALSYLLVLRLMPLFPFWLVNLVPAFLGVSLRTYVIGTFVGIIPGTLVYALVGGGIGDVIEAGHAPELNTIFHPHVLLALGGLAALALAPVVYKMWRARRR